MKSFLIYCIVITVIGAITGISLESRSRQSTVGSTTVRIKCLEANTISYARLDNTQMFILKTLDTVWVDLDTHTVCDTCKYAMKSVLYK